MIIRTVYGIVIGFIFAIISNLLGAPSNQIISLILFLAILILYIPSIVIVKISCLIMFKKYSKRRDIMIYISAALTSWVTFYNIIY